METIAEVIKRIAKATNRVKFCEACRKYYEAGKEHKCLFTAEQLAEYSKLVERKAE